MKEALWAYGIGILTGLLVAVGLSATPWSLTRIAKDAKEACEKSLPRDQTGKVIAVPNAQEGRHD